VQFEEPTALGIALGQRRDLEVRTPEGLGERHPRHVHVGEVEFPVGITDLGIDHPATLDGVPRPQVAVGQGRRRGRRQQGLDRSVARPLDPHPESRGHARVRQVRPHPPLDEEGGPVLEPAVGLAEATGLVVAVPAVPIRRHGVHVGDRPAKPRPVGRTRHPLEDQRAAGVTEDRRHRDPRAGEGGEPVHLGVGRVRRLLDDHCGAVREERPPRGADPPALEQVRRHRPGDPGGPLSAGQGVRVTRSGRHPATVTAWRSSSA